MNSAFRFCRCIYRNASKQLTRILCYWISFYFLKMQWKGETQWIYPSLPPFITQCRVLFKMLLFIYFSRITTLKTCRTLKRRFCVAATLTGTAKSVRRNLLWFYWLCLSTASKRSTAANQSRYSLAADGARVSRIRIPVLFRIVRWISIIIDHHLAHLSLNDLESKTIPFDRRFFVNLSSFYYYYNKNFHLQISLWPCSSLRCQHFINNINSSLFYKHFFILLLFSIFCLI